MKWFLKRCYITNQVLRILQNLAGLDWSFAKEKVKSSESLARLWTETSNNLNVISRPRLACKVTPELCPRFIQEGDWCKMPPFPAVWGIRSNILEWNSIWSRVYVFLEFSYRWLFGGIYLFRFFVRSHERCMLSNFSDLQQLTSYWFDQNTPMPSDFLAICL